MSSTISSPAIQEIESPDAAAAQQQEANQSKPKPVTIKPFHAEICNRNTFSFYIFTVNCKFNLQDTANVKFKAVRDGRTKGN